MTILADEILSVDDLKREPIEIPEWNQTLFVREMTGFERDSFESHWAAGEGKVDPANLANIRARMAVKCLVEEDGTRVFRDDQADALGEKNAKALDRIFSVILRLNKLTPEDVEDLAGNSDADQKGESG